MLNGCVDEMKDARSDDRDAASNGMKWNAVNTDSPRCTQLADNTQQFGESDTMRGDTAMRPGAQNSETRSSSALGGIRDHTSTYASKMLIELISTQAGPISCRLRY